MMTVAAMFCIAVMAEDEKNIAQREYWFDNDISTRTTLSENATVVSIEGLPQGLHSFTMRVQDSEGFWSSTMTKYFVVKPTTTTTTVATCEYWFDNNVANRKPLSESVAIVDLSGLPQGLHSFTMRVKNDAGVWSSPMTKYFVVKPTPTTTTVAACEYWFDNDVENRKPLSESVAIVDLSGLTQGLHAFTMRVKNDAGVWSSPITKYFLVPSASEVNGNAITRCQYWFDDAIEEENFAELITTCALESEGNNMVMVDLGDLPVGTHTIWWRVGDSKGAWSEPLSETFVIELITTGVDSPYSTEEDSHAVWFTIDGKKGTGTMNKGIVIVNGKKIIVK